VLERLRRRARHGRASRNELTGDLEWRWRATSATGAMGEGPAGCPRRWCAGDRQPRAGARRRRARRRALRRLASIVASHIVSILAVPLVIRDRLAGAIYVDHLKSQHLFGNKDLDFLVAFADQAAWRSTTRGSTASSRRIAEAQGRERVAAPRDPLLSASRHADREEPRHRPAQGDDRARWRRAARRS
jgi:hypothetical protein